MKKTTKPILAVLSILAFSCTKENPVFRTSGLIGESNMELLYTDMISPGTIPSVIIGTQVWMKKNWTGNIRELRNVVERLVILGGKVISKDDVVNFVAMPR